MANVSDPEDASADGLFGESSSSDDASHDGARASWKRYRGLFGDSDSDSDDTTLLPIELPTRNDSLPPAKRPKHDPNILVRLDFGPIASQDFSVVIYKLLKTIQPDLGITNDGMKKMNTQVNNAFTYFGRLVAETCHSDNSTANALTREHAMKAAAAFVPPEWLPGVTQKINSVLATFSETQTKKSDDDDNIVELEAGGTEQEADDSNDDDDSNYDPMLDTVDPSYGLVLPVAMIHTGMRFLRPPRQAQPEIISGPYERTDEADLCLTVVMEFLLVEFITAAANMAKSNRESRIGPMHVSLATDVNHDPTMNKLSGALLVRYCILFLCVESCR